MILDFRQLETPTAPPGGPYTLTINDFGMHKITYVSGNITLPAISASFFGSVAKYRNVGSSNISIIYSGSTGRGSTDISPDQEVVVRVIGANQYDLVNPSSGGNAIRVAAFSVAASTPAPVLIHNLTIGEYVIKVEARVGLAFDGAPSINVGLIGLADRYAKFTALELTQVVPGPSTNTNLFERVPSFNPSSAEAIYVEVVPGGATFGVATIFLHYVDPR